MPKRSAPRRTQFSSCDACRRSRVACDASKSGHRPGRVRWTGSCSRCSRRNRSCTFEWISEVRKKASNAREDGTAHSPANEPNPFTPSQINDEAEYARTCQPSCRYTETCNPVDTGYAPLNVDAEPESEVDLQQTTPLSESGTFIREFDSTILPRSRSESVDALLSRWCSPIFHHGFDSIFGLLIGRNGCPFVDNPTIDKCIPATKLFSELDAAINDDLTSQNTTPATESQGHRKEVDLQIGKSLNQAIRSFTARWLPLVAHRDLLSVSQVEEVARHSWRIARTDMLRVINRTSYRSALALYLFSQTPIPAGISEDEELDGISGSLCLQTALLQIQRLRERRRSYQPDQSRTLAWRDLSPGSGPASTLAQTFIDFESRAYWAVVMWDTSSSLAFNHRTFLTSGLNGGCSEPAWRLARSFIVGSFHPKAENWRTTSFEISEEVASQIIAAASVCMVYVWKNLTSLKEALREGVDEDSVLFVWTALLDAINIFKTSIRPLLDKCERCLHFIDQISRLSWYEISLQFYWGLLVLFDTLESASRADLMAQIMEVRQDVMQESFNVLKFGVENTYTIDGLTEDPPSASGPGFMPDIPGETITASFVAIDPHPDYVVDTALLLGKVISRRYHQGKIRHESYSHLSSTLLKALGKLPQSSKIVQAAQQNLHEILRDVNAIHVTETGVRAP